jgi:hypothetical protein
MIAEAMEARRMELQSNIPHPDATVVWLPKKRSKRNITVFDKEADSSVTTSVLNATTVVPYTEDTAAMESQVPPEPCVDNIDLLIEIVEVNEQNNELPIVTPNVVRDILIRIRTKNMVKGVTKMTEIYNNLVKLESDIDHEIMEATISHNIPPQI